MLLIIDPLEVWPSANRVMVAAVYRWVPLQILFCGCWPWALLNCGRHNASLTIDANLADMNVVIGNLFKFLESHAAIATLVVFVFWQLSAECLCLLQFSTRHHDWNHYWLCVWLAQALRVRALIALRAIKIRDLTYLTILLLQFEQLVNFAVLSAYLWRLRDYFRNYFTQFLTWRFFAQLFFQWWVHSIRIWLWSLVDRVGCVDRECAASLLKFLGGALLAARWEESCACASFKVYRMLNLWSLARRGSPALRQLFDWQLCKVQLKILVYNCSPIKTYVLKLASLFQATLSKEH